MQPRPQPHPEPADKADWKAMSTNLKAPAGLACPIDAVVMCRHVRCGARREGRRTHYACREGSWKTPPGPHPSQHIHHRERREGGGRHAGKASRTPQHIPVLCCRKKKTVLQHKGQSKEFGYLNSTRKQQGLEPSPAEPARCRNHATALPQYE